MKIRYIVNIFEKDLGEFKNIRNDGSRLENYFNRHIRQLYKVRLNDCIPVINGRLAEWSAAPFSGDEITIVRKISISGFGE